MYRVCFRYQFIMSTMELKNYMHGQIHSFTVEITRHSSEMIHATVVGFERIP